MQKKIPIERLREVERRLVSAESPTEFTIELAVQWKITRRHVWRYVAVVRRQLAEQAKLNSDPMADLEISKSMALNAYRTAQAGSEKFGADVKTMTQAARIYAEITGSSPLAQAKLALMELEQEHKREETLLIKATREGKVKPLPSDLDNLHAKVLAILARRGETNNPGDQLSADRGSDSDQQPSKR